MTRIALLRALIATGDAPPTLGSIRHLTVEAFGIDGTYQLVDETPEHWVFELMTHCAGGAVDPIYVGTSYGLCPSCDEFVVIDSYGATLRHWRTA